MDRKLVTAPSLRWYINWLRTQENPDEWRYVNSVSHLLEYTDVTLYVLTNVNPMISAEPGYRAYLEARNITMEFIDG